MSIKSILFNTEKVRTILDERKTVTWQVVKPFERIPESATFGYTAFTPKNHISARGYLTDKYGDKRFGETFFKLPYYPDDILYVQKTWKWAMCGPAGGGYALTDLYLYKADEPIDTTGMEVEERWHPSIHMPREAARIFLRVMDVRVERLQNITELDILEKEGITVDFPNPKPTYMSLAYAETKLKSTVKKAFADLWDSTIKPKDHALYGWDADPWVWAISFERCEKPKEW